MVSPGQSSIFFPFLLSPGLLMKQFPQVFFSSSYSDSIEWLKNSIEKKKVYRVNIAVVLIVLVLIFKLSDPGGIKLLTVSQLSFDSKVTYTTGNLIQDVSVIKPICSKCF